jgi:hypothetical protein
LTGLNSTVIRSGPSVLTGLNSIGIRSEPSVLTGFNLTTIRSGPLYWQVLIKLLFDQNHLY